MKVFFIDDRGFDETLTSASTYVVSPAIWSGIMRVGSQNGHSGYSYFGPMGTVNNNRFWIGDSDHGVLVVMHDASTLSLRVHLSAGTNMSLHIGDAEFDLADATEAQEGPPGYFQWPKGSLNWSTGDIVHLSLEATD